MFDFLTIDILCITVNSGHSFDILKFDFLLKPAHYRAIFENISAGPLFNEL